MNRYRLSHIGCQLLLITCLSLSTAFADSGEENTRSEDEDPAPQAVVGPSFRPGLLIQSIADFQSEASGGQNGFSLAKARLNVTGQVDGSWDYLVQTDFANSLTLLDARVRYQADSPFGVAAGMYKVPFSQEWLTSAARIDFVKRSQVVSALSPKRDVGVTVTTRLSSVVSLHTGLFNGNGRSLSGNDNNRFLYVARMDAAPTQSLNIGANIAHNQGSDRPGDIEQLLLGGDIRFTPKAFLLSGEAIYGEQTHSAAANLQSFGYHVTAGYTLPTELMQQILLRWDQFTPDLDKSRSSLFVLGYNVNPSDVIGIQVNYLMPTDQALQQHQLLVDLQLAW